MELPWMGSRFMYWLLCFMLLCEVWNENVLWGVKAWLLYFFVVAILRIFFTLFTSYTSPRFGSACFREITDGHSAVTSSKRWFQEQDDDNRGGQLYRVRDTGMVSEAGGWGGGRLIQEGRKEKKEEPRVCKHRWNKQEAKENRFFGWIFHVKAKATIRKRPYIESTLPKIGN